MLLGDPDPCEELNHYTYTHAIDIAKSNSNPKEGGLIKEKVKVKEKVMDPQDRERELKQQRNRLIRDTLLWYSLVFTVYLILSYIFFPGFMNVWYGWLTVEYFTGWFSNPFW